jgi:beta-mannosidase
LATLREQSQGQAARVHGPVWKQGAPRDLGAGWDFDDVRDHYVEALYGVRADQLRAYDPARHLMLGRAAVAETMAAAFARWRSAGSVCRGALVFTLRDLRPGAGWGVLDDCGRPKSGFHGLAAAWQARSLLLTDEGLNGVTLQVVNDPADAVAGELELKLFRDGHVLVAEGRAPVAVAGHSVTAVPAQALLEGFLDINWAYRFGPPVANVLWACWRNEQGDVLSERLMFLPTVAGLQGQELGLSARAEAQADGSRRVTVGTQRAARGLHFEAEGWVADHEWFDLAPAGSRTVVLRPSGPKVRAFRGLVQAINGLTPAVISGGA